MTYNYNCDGMANFCSEDQEVRRLPTGGTSASIVCFNHYKKEMEYRKVRNLVLGESLIFPIGKALKSTMESNKEKEV